MERVRSAVAWFIFVTAVSAQSQCLSLTSKFPDCVAGCITSGAINEGCTNTLDLSCQCNPDSSAAIQSFALGCATSACEGDAASLLSGLKAGSSICDCVTSAASGGLFMPVEANPTGEPQPQSDYEEGQDAADCQEVIVTVVETITEMTVPHGTQVPLDDMSDDGPLGSKVGACFEAALSGLPACAAVCYDDAAGYAGCASHDYRCQCRDSSGGDLNYFLNECVRSACKGSDSMTQAGSIVSQACACLSMAKSEANSDYMLVQEPHARNIEMRDAPQAPEGDQPQDAATTAAPNVDLMKENCTSLAEKVMPACAQSCYLSMASDVQCDRLDFACQCKSDVQARLTTMMMPCVMSACNLGDLPDVIAGGSSVCSCASATGNAQDIWGIQAEAAVPAQTAEPRAAPAAEPEQQVSATTTCSVVSVQAQDCAAHRPTFAPCGRDCLSPVVPQVGCDMNDILCQCAPDKQAALSALVQPCVEESCQQPTAMPIMWNPSAMCACASGHGSYTTCWGTSISGWTSWTSNTNPGSTSSRSTTTWTEATTWTADGTTFTAYHTTTEGAAGRYGVSAIAAVAAAVFMAAVAL